MRARARLLAAGATLALAVGAPASAATSQAHKARTPIKHLVFLLQENHTFDNYFGTRAGVDGLPAAGVCMPVHPPKAHPCVRPFHIGSEGSTDLDHSVQSYAAQFDGGRMDGFVSAITSGNGALAMGHYDRTDLPYYWRVADNYVLFDHFFSSVAAGSPMNHLFSVTAAPPAVAPRGDEVPASGWGNIETIFDRLQAAGVSWKFYVQNYDPSITYRTRAAVSADRSSQVIWVPPLAMPRFIDNPTLASHIVDMSQYYRDVASGHLPAVSYMVPSGDSEHPPGSVASGETFVRGLITELERSPEWPSSAFLLSYDDWGGWYDHVKPPRVDAYGYGFRVPALLVSPYAKRGYVDHTTLDFTSVLKFIEKNWSVPPLAQRDARANNLTSAFDFTAPARKPVLLDAAATPAGAPKAHRTPVLVVYSAAVALVVVFLLTLTLRDRRRRRLARRQTVTVPPRRPVGGGVR